MSPTYLSLLTKLIGFTTLQILIFQITYTYKAKAVFKLSKMDQKNLFMKVDS